MTGSLRIDKGKYYAVLNLKDETGKRKQKVINLMPDAVPGNKRKADKALRETIAEYEAKRITVYRKDILFHEYIAGWLECARMDIDHNTYESYLSNINVHIAPYFQQLGVVLQDVEYRHLDDYYTEKRKTLSVCTLKKHHAVIKQALRKAVQNRLIAHNPANDYKFPKIEKYKGNFLTTEQGSILLDAAHGTQIEPAIILGMLCGLRRSEIAGLRYSAIDFKENTMTIQHSVTKFSTKLAKDRVKNESSNRVLPLNATIRSYLLKLRAQQAQDKLLLGRAYQDNDYVCRWPDGHPVSCDYLSRAFKRLLIKCGLPKEVRLHDLRHTCASYMLKMGCSIKAISTWLGHADIQTSMNIYAHLDMDAKKDIADSFENMFQLKM